MVTWEHASAVAQALPGAEASTSYRNPCWKVGGTAFLTLRPLRKADREALGEAAPDGPTVLVGVANLLEREALLEAEGPAVFVTPHFDGHPAVLVDLELVAPDLLEDLIEHSWELAAPPA